jgi:uncharacterized membrane protein YoaK (UPF0700 family)
MGREGTTEADQKRPAALDSTEDIAIACLLSGVAGYVDGIGYIHLGGLFVSFMSGNSTRLGVSIVDADWSHASEAIGLIVLFIAGAAAGSLIAHVGGRHRRSLILLVETVLLAAAALVNRDDLAWLAVALIVVAMGLENAIFQVGGAGGLGLTYITGALVKAGQLIASALTGGPRWTWIPNLLLWAALVVGATLGAFAYGRYQLAAIWLAAAATLVLCALLTVLTARSARAGARD